MFPWMLRLSVDGLESGIEDNGYGIVVAAAIFPGRDISTRSAVGQRSTGYLDIRSGKC